MERESVRLDYIDVPPGTDPAHAEFEFKILGTVEVWRAGRLMSVGAAKQRIILVSLLMDANRVVPMESLVTRLWGADPPACARKTLQNYVLRLRRVLDGTGGTDSLVSTHASGYQINVDGKSCDLYRFEGLMAQARDFVAAGEPAAASVHLGQALALWRAEPLADVPSEQLRLELLPALVEKHLNAVELRIDVDLMLGRHADVLPELHELTTAYPLHERFWSQRILALYRAGRQGEALECHRRVRTLLSEELGVLPGTELAGLLQQILTTDPALIEPAARSSAPVPAGNLAADTASFIGRSRQLDQARALLGKQSVRLVTFTGVAGVGKSRLALRVAAQDSEAFVDGAWVADLASASCTDHIGQILTDVLEIPGRPQYGGPTDLVERLRGKQALLVLDNCEHIVGEVAALVVTLLRALPGLRILVTSRQRLGMPGEQVVQVPPMPVPQDGDHDRALSGCDAVDLLLSRARAAAPDFRITPFNRDLVIRLCRKLDGLPLAIELAAARLSVMSLNELVDRLADRFRLLNRSGSDNSLLEALHRSWALCTEHERWLWARLSVFSDGFDIDEVEQVCSDDGIASDEVMDLVAGLVDKSIVVADTNGARTRYRLLETIEDYGRMRLAESDESAVLDRRYRRRLVRREAEIVVEVCR
jgi:predicted ATPase/DNA-binding SARP family transcriptional activator